VAGAAFPALFLFWHGITLVYPVVGVHAERTTLTAELCTGTSILKEIKTMKKSDLIIALSEKEGLREQEAFDIVNLVFAGFTDTLRKGGRIEIRGFGSFTIRNYPPYLGKNPKTGQRVKVGPKKLPYFKVGKELKEGVNHGKASK
jgi:integration host factor subunit beta